MLRNSNNERFRAGERPADTSIHGYERARPFRMQDAVRSGSGGPEGEDAFSERLATIQGMFKDAIFRKGGTGKAALAQLRRAFRLADMDNSGVRGHHDQTTPRCQQPCTTRPPPVAPCAHRITRRHADHHPRKPLADRPSTGTSLYSPSERATACASYRTASSRSFSASSVRGCDELLRLLRTDRRPPTAAAAA